MSDLISIVLPVYNGEKFLRESIESVLAQTYVNWELLILDDCSTDSTSKIAEEYVQKDARIKYYRNKENLRLPKNLNKGFSLAKGSYLTWTSDDNRYRPNALEKMYSALNKNEDVQFAFSSFRIMDAKDKDIEMYIVSEKDEKKIVGFNVVGACFLYKREVYEVVGDYDPDMILVEDYDYWQRVFMKFKAVAITDVLYDYRRHEGALSSTMRQAQFNTNLEKLLLKNKDGFGKLDVFQKYYLYTALYNCRRNLQSTENPYVYKFYIYKVLYFIIYRIPEKFKSRLVKKS